MPDTIDRLADCVHSRIRLLGFSTPSTAVLRVMLRVAYFATLKTEEGRFVLGSITYADPAAPDVSPPICRRADYPGFTKLASAITLSVEALVKLSRGVDKWSGSIAVYGRKKSDLAIWGILDQLADQNIRRNRESDGGFSFLGILTTNMEGVGAISVYHDDFFLAALNGQDIVTRQIDALRSPIIAKRIRREFKQPAIAIARSLKQPKGLSVVLDSLFNSWVSTVARLCIGLRRLGTGGALLITPSPVLSSIDISYQIDYSRLEGALILKVLDEKYLAHIQHLVHEIREHPNQEGNARDIPENLYRLEALAEADAEDRESELSGAVKLVTSFAAMDGLVLLHPNLAVHGFGCKISGGPNPTVVYDGADFSRKGTAARAVDLSRFGTRHSSMLRYCQLDRAAIGIVISQDKHVRVIASAGNNLILWDRVKLLNEDDFTNRAAQIDIEQRERRAHLARTRPAELGFTTMPKTVADLLKDKDDDH